MALTNALNVAGLLAFAGQYAPTIIKSLLQELEVNRHFSIDTAVTNSKRYPKMTIGNLLGPYTGAKDTNGGEIVFSDRELMVDVGQATMAIDPEIMRRTFLGVNSKITDGKVKYEEAFITYYLEKIFQQFNSETFWKGDKALADNPGNRSKRMMDGLEKDLLAAITATLIAPVTTAAWSGGSGWNAGMTDGNVIQGFEAVWMALRAPYRKNNSRIFCSEAVFKLYCDQYNRRYNRKVEFIDQSKTEMEMDGTSGKAIITKAYWLGSSSRILAVNNGAIQVGTDKPDFISELDIQKDGFNYWYGSKFVAGVRIIDPEAMSVNSLA
ncbi:hypothetical protein [Emticicia fontis]